MLLNFSTAIIIIRTADGIQKLALLNKNVLNGEKSYVTNNYSSLQYFFLKMFPIRDNSNLSRAKGVANHRG